MKCLLSSLLVWLTVGIEPMANGQSTPIPLKENLYRDLAEVGGNQLSGGLKQKLSLSEMLNGEIHEEIYNGQDATKGQFPYQALLINKKSSGASLCGGSLISNRYVLTAAHCSDQTTSTTVYLGLTSTNDGNGAVYYEVPANSTYIHPDYNPNNFQNDIAILKLPGTVTLTNLIQTIALAKSAWSNPSTFDDYYVTASGWGRTSDNDSGITQQLQWRTIHKMRQSSCVYYYRNINQITNGMICTDKNPVYSGPCQGDSGGPLTVKVSNVLYVIGAVSWTAGQCSTDQPIVYANVPYYRNWINQVTGIAAT